VKYIGSILFLLSVFLALPSEAYAVPNDPLNQVMVVYSDNTCQIVLWKDVEKLSNHLQYLIVKVFHHQSPNPSSPANVIEFSGNDLLYLRGTPVGLLVGRRDETPGVQKESGFDAESFGQEINRSLLTKLFDLQIAASKLVLLTYDYSATDYNAKVAAARLLTPADCSTP